MPLDKPGLQNAIAVALTVDPNNPNRAAADVAADLASAIHTFVKSGDVVQVSTTVSVTVATTGTATAQTGTGTGTGTQVGTAKIT